MPVSSETWVRDDIDLQHWEKWGEWTGTFA
jgi:hypothetical protein